MAEFQIVISRFYYLPLYSMYTVFHRTPHVVW